jgi:hypothetical protein
MEKFKNAIMTLASSAKVQDSLYPDFVAKGDELVLDYDDALREVDIKSKLNTKQKTALNKLDAYLTEHSGEEYEEMYCDSASLYTDSRWEQIRELATTFIASMGWQYELPSKSNAVYVKSK